METGLKLSAAAIGLAAVGDAGYLANEINNNNAAHEQVVKTAAEGMQGMLERIDHDLQQGNLPEAQKQKLQKDRQACLLAIKAFEKPGRESPENK